jgi:hypothetical protein
MHDRYYLEDEVNGDEIGKASIMHRRDEKILIVKP